MNQAVLDPFIESRVEAFELAVAQRPDTRLDDFLPAADHDRYRELLTELIRVDLDLAWDRNQRPTLQQYRERFPKFFQDEEALEQLTFEEFRQRRQAGDDVEPEEYASSYHIDTKKWQSWTAIENTDMLPAILPQVVTDLAAPRVGSQWQGFDLIRELGSGSFARALLARQTALSNRDVVLKFSRLRSNEAQRLAELQHTNIVPIFSVHADAGQTVMCMPFLGETTLANLTGKLSQEETVPTGGETICQVLPTTDASPEGADGEALDYYRNHSYVESVLWLIARLADALHHSHKRNILHCDIKPANIILRCDGEPMLIDFNLAVQSDRQAALFAAGGTLPYMAPEQLRALDGQSSTLDARCDVYGLGVLLYQLLTGRLPWTAPAAREDLDAWLEARRQRWTPPTQLNVQTTPAIIAILQKCLAYDGDDRYQTAQQLRDDLRRQLDHQPLRFAPNTSWRESLSKWRLRQPWLFSLSSAAVLCVACVVVLAAAWQIRESRLAGDRAAIALGQLEEQALELRPALALAALDPLQSEPMVQEAIAVVRQHQIDQEAGVSATWKHLNGAQRDAWRRESSALCALVASIETVRLQRTAEVDDQQALLKSAKTWNDHAARWGGLNEELIERQRMLLEAWRSDGPTTESLAVTQSSEAAQAESGVGAMLLGLESLMSSDPQAAARLFRGATERVPTDATNWLMLAEAQMKMSEYSQAEACLDVAGSLLPGSHLPLFRRGLCRMAQGRYPAAIDDFTTVLAIRPDIVEARLNRALAYQGLSDHEQALADVDAAIAAGCRQTRVHFIRARLRQALGDLAGSAAAHREGLALTPSDEDSWIARGYAKLTVDPEAALADFEAALAENPLSTVALQNIAHVLSERLDYPERAIEALSKALSIRPSDTLARAGRGVLLARWGKIDAALADAKTLAEAQQLEPVARYQVGCIYALCCRERPELKSLAISAIAESFAADRQLVDVAKADADLDPIREWSAFAELMETALEFNKFRQTHE